jgi:hypothetical protein
MRRFLTPQLRFKRTAQLLQWRKPETWHCVVRIAIALRLQCVDLCLNLGDLRLRGPHLTSIDVGIRLRVRVYYCHNNNLPLRSGSGCSTTHSDL